MKYTSDWQKVIGISKGIAYLRTGAWALSAEGSAGVGSGYGWQWAVQRECEWEAWHRSACEAECVTTCAKSQEYLRGWVWDSLCKVQLFGSFQVILPCLPGRRDLWWWARWKPSSVPSRPLGHLSCRYYLLVTGFFFLSVTRFCCF